MEKGLVTIVIPNYNYARYLGEAVDSALGQTYPNKAVIVIDDGSDDGSRELVESYGDRIRSVFQTNQGVSAARNNGASMARGEFLAFLDADDAWMPEKLARQIEWFTNEPGLGLVHTGVLEVGTTGVVNERLDGQEGHVAGELLLLKRPVILGGGSGIVVPKRVFDEAGGFDTRLSTSADWELFYRICSRYGVGFVPEVLVRYRVHDSNMHNNVEAMEHDVRIGFSKAFSDKTSDVQKIRGDALAGFHSMLAGSYFHQARYVRSIVHAIASMWHKPRSIGHFFARRAAFRGQQ